VLLSRCRGFGGGRYRLGLRFWLGAPGIRPRLGHLMLAGGQDKSGGK